MSGASPEGVAAPIEARRSPYCYTSRPIDSADLRAIFEAGRWAASSFNEQPWRYIVATSEDPDGFARMLSCLVEPNQAWARVVPVLALGVTRLRFERNDRDNGTARHDLGAASAQIAVEAAARGLQVHQMAGILPDRARELYHVPEPFAVVTALAIGFPGSNDELDAELKDRDAAPRSRRPLSETVFAGDWGETAPWLE